MNNKGVSNGLDYQTEIRDLREKLAEAEETLRAIGEGEVDAIIVSGEGGERIFSLSGAEQVYRLIVETMKEAALTVAFDQTILFCNAQFGQFLKLPQERILGHRLGEFVTPEHAPAISDLINRSAKVPVKQRLVFQSEAQSALPAHISATILNQPDGVSICIVATDLTELETSTEMLQQLRRQQEALLDSESRLRAVFAEQKKAEEALKASHDLLEQKVDERTSELADAIEMLQAEIVRRKAAETGLRQTNQLLRMFSDCNEAIVRIDDEQRLMNELCRIIVEVSDYRFAWVGFAEEDEYKTVRPISYAGLDGDYLESVRVSWDDSERGRGPTGRAIRTGKVQFGRDFLNDPALSPWRELARQHGFRSSISLPLADGETVFGALSIYAGEVSAFAEPEVKILTELADDLAYGFLALRTRTALRESRDRLRQMAAELTRAEQRERERIASILHDHIQQLLVAAKFQLAAFNGPGYDLQKGTRELQQLLDETIKASRTLTAELSPPVLKEGLAASLTWLGEWMAEKYGLTVDVDIDAAVSPLVEETKILLFESARELLFNVAKHAQTNTASLSLHKLGSDCAEIVVQDSGIGFDPNRVKSGRAPGGGFGLLSLRQRMELIGGQLAITSKPGKGSRFTLTIPTNIAANG